MISTTQLVGLLAAFGLPITNALAIQARATDIWLTLPATPALPSPINTATTAINGVNLWMQEYNKAAGGTPIVMDHGGLGYSAYFGDVITQLVANNRYVIAVDRRGHGRSTFNDADSFTYDMFANDIFAQLTSIGVTSYNVVGWSDGAATTLAALQNATIAAGIQKAFVFAGFMVPEDTNTTFASSAIFSEFVSRSKSEYATNQPSADFTAFATKVNDMEAALPQFTTAQLGAIDGSKVAIVGAEYDEAVNLEVPAKLNAAIPGSTLVMLSNVSHFAPMQDPTGFTKAVEDFLA